MLPLLEDEHWEWSSAPPTRQSAADREQLGRTARAHPSRTATATRADESGTVELRTGEKTRQCTALDWSPFLSVKACVVPDAAWASATELRFLALVPRGGSLQTRTRTATGSVAAD